jgi:shikimate dehydrogenase
VAPLAHVETMSIAASRAARLANIVQATDDRPISLTSSKKLTFYIFGHPVTMSPSPDIHNVGFASNGFPHVYERCDREDVADVIRTIRSEACGGGSVTIPHKESVLPFMDELTEAAKQIGAVNTVIKLSNCRLRGDNTDWLGIKNQLEAKAPRFPAGTPLIAVICGAGGTAKAAAFALKKMGVSRVLIFNRTLERAERLAAEYGFEAVGELGALDALPRLDFVVDTLPGATEFVFPLPLLERFRPTCLEAAYIPRQTAFVRQALAAACPVVEGIEMLFEQGCAQCSIWTGRDAPRAAIAANLLTQLFSDNSAHPAAPKMEPRDAPPEALLRELNGTASVMSQPRTLLLLLAVTAVAVHVALVMRRSNN